MMADKLHLPGPIVIAAGGTGGHLFPGQALAQELGRRGHEVVLLTDERVQRFEHWFPQADIYAVPAATIAGPGLAGVLSSLWKIFSGTAQSYSIYGRIKPSAVIGFGGYPTLPPVLAAAARRIPTCVHEQNAVLGRVNRLAARFVDALASTFEAPKYLRVKDAHKVEVTGNPVRDAAMAHAGAPYQAPRADESFHLLVTGGSQGARVMSDVVPAALAQLPEVLRKRLKLVQQAREEDLIRVKAAYEEAGIEAELSSFFDDMPARIARAHLVIGRAGASTVSELAVIGRPSLLVPLPHSIDQDQKANAELLSSSGAGWMIEQEVFTPGALAARLTELMNSPDVLASAAAAALKQGRPDAVTRLADLVERLALGKTQRLGTRGAAKALPGGKNAGENALKLSSVKEYAR